MKDSSSDPWLTSDTFRVNYTATTDFKFEDFASKKHTIKTYFKDGVDHIQLPHHKPTKVSFKRISSNKIWVDADTIVYYLEYFADHKYIHIIDQKGLVKSIKRFEKDHGDEA